MGKIRIVTSLLLICVGVLCGGYFSPLTVHAEETGVAESRMTYITTYTTDLGISDTGVASIIGIVRGKAGVTSTYVKCTLQMSIGGGWVDVKTWEVSSTTNGATISETYQLSSRGTYRVYMECRANTEEKTGTSAYRTY